MTATPFFVSVERLLALAILRPIGLTGRAHYADLFTWRFWREDLLDLWRLWRVIDLLLAEREVGA